jgi:MFS family permease
MFSLAAFIAAQLGHCLLTSVQGPQVYLLRTLMTVGIAGAFGSSLTHVSLLAPPGRMGEYIGVLGSSGFIGLALGPWLGDLLLADVPATPQAMLRMFGWAAAAGLAALLLASRAGRPATPHRPLAQATLRRRRSIGVLALIRRYHPGPLLLIGAAMGLGLGLPGVFVRPFAQELHIDRVKLFFLVYAATAFSVRMVARRWTDIWGVRPMVLSGCSLLAASMLVFCTVSNVWMLALPAVTTGMAHALLFPAVVTGAGQSFAARNRGLATNLIMAMFDLGGLLGQPLAASVLWTAGKLGGPRYTSMFVVMSVVLSLATLYYALATRNTRPARRFVQQRVPRR